MICMALCAIFLPFALHLLFSQSRLIIKKKVKNLSDEIELIRNRVKLDFTSSLVFIYFSVHLQSFYFQQKQNSKGFIIFHSKYDLRKIVNQQRINLLQLLQSAEFQDITMVYCFILMIKQGQKKSFYYYHDKDIESIEVIFYQTVFVQHQSAKIVNQKFFKVQIDAQETPSIEPGCSTIRTIALGHISMRQSIKEQLSEMRPYSYNIWQYIYEILIHMLIFLILFIIYSRQMSCSAEEAHKIIQQNAKNPQFKIIDVRSPGEFQSGHIQGAILMPLGDLPDRLNELHKEDVHLMVCRSGARSGSATFTLKAKGFKSINLEGGMISWAALKYPIQIN